jgi:glucokinase
MTAGSAGPRSTAAGRCGGSIERVGVDLGGTQLRVAAFAGDSQTPIAQHRELVGEPRDLATIVERLAVIIERLASDARGVVAVGVGIAAMLRDRAGTVVVSPHLRWRDVAFGPALAARLGPRFALGVYNDVNAIVWGEAIAGAARGCRDVLGVYVGTGIGAGVIADGHLVLGASQCAGELGHVKVRWDDDALACACGQRGCFEAYLGGSYLERRIRSELAGAARSSLSARDPGTIHVGDVDAAAAEGDAWALALWTELAPLAGVAIGGAIALLNPERVVLGGGVLGRCPLLRELVIASLSIATPSAALEPLTIAVAELGDDAGLVGAAALAAADLAITHSPE